MSEAVPDPGGPPTPAAAAAMAGRKQRNPFPVADLERAMTARGPRPQDVLDRYAVAVLVGTSPSNVYNWLGYYVKPGRSKGPMFGPNTRSLPRLRALVYCADRILNGESWDKVIPRFVEENLPQEERSPALTVLSWTPEKRHENRDLVREFARNHERVVGGPVGARGRVLWRSDPDSPCRERARAEFDEAERRAEEGDPSVFRSLGVVPGESSEATPGGTAPAPPPRRSILRDRQPEPRAPRTAAAGAGGPSADAPPAKTPERRSLSEDERRGAATEAFDLIRRVRTLQKSLQGTGYDDDLDEPAGGLIGVLEDLAGDV